MDFRQVAVFKERKLREENEELKEKIKKLEEENFDLKARVEELESQNDYECECNKDFVVYQNENERLKKILGCAVSDLYFHNYTKRDVIKSLEITEEEYNKYIGE